MKSEPRIIKEKVERAIRRFLKNDLFLLVNNVDEWAITHKFAMYLQPYFSDWHIDVEYNRDKDKIKRDNGKDVRPDIIVHIRNTDNNLLVIEIKKSNNLHLIDADRERLYRFTSQRGKYKYLFGSLVIFYVAEGYYKQPVVEFFQKGKHLD